MTVTYSHSGRSFVRKAVSKRTPCIRLYSIGVGMPLVLSLRAIFRMGKPSLYIPKIMDTTSAAVSSTSRRFLSCGAFRYPKGTKLPTYSPFLRLTSRLVRILMDMSRQ